GRVENGRVFVPRAEERGTRHHGIEASGLHLFEHLGLAPELACRIRLDLDPGSLEFLLHSRDAAALERVARFVDVPKTQHACVGIATLSARWDVLLIDLA